PWAYQISPTASIRPLEAQDKSPSIASFKGFFIQIIPEPSWTWTHALPATQAIVEAGSAASVQCSKLLIHATECAKIPWRLCLGGRLQIGSRRVIVIGHSSFANDQ